MDTADELRAAAAPYGANAEQSATNTDTESNQDIRQLKAEISETRTQLQDTVAEITERLSPAHLKDQATDAVRAATVGRVQHMMHQAGDTLGQAGQATRNVADNVRAEVRNSPIPYALIAVGAAWLLSSKRGERRWSTSNSSDRRFATREAGRGFGPTEYGTNDYRSSGAANMSSDEYGSGANDWRARQSNRDSWSASQMRNRWETLLEDNPMVLGIAAMATGALVAAAIPATEVENRYMGEVRENVVESAKEVAQTAVDQIAGADKQQAT
jgi:hypothetical protein